MVNCIGYATKIKSLFFIDDLALAMMDEKRNLVFALSEPSPFLPKVTQGTDIRFLPAYIQNVIEAMH